MTLKPACVHCDAPKYRYSGPNLDGCPTFRCNTCGKQWTSGEDGGVWSQHLTTGAQPPVASALTTVYNRQYLSDNLDRTLMFRLSQWDENSHSVYRVLPTTTRDYKLPLNPEFQIIRSVLVGLKEGGFEQAGTFLYYLVRKMNDEKSKVVFNG